MLQSRDMSYSVLLAAVCLWHSQSFSVPLSKEALEKIDHIVTCHDDVSLSVEVRSLSDNQVVYAKDSAKRLVPASNTKIVTSLLALEMLGKDHQFVTTLASDAPIADGALQGNLYLKGSGDPSLKSTDIEQLIKTLRQQGVARVEGDFCCDRDEFDHEGFSAGTTIDDLGEEWFNPIGALVVDHKALDLHPRNEVAFTDSAKMNGMFCDGVPLLTGLLKKYDIALKGSVTFGRCGEGNVLAQHTSEKLPVLLQNMMKESDNLYADCLFKKVGAVRYGVPGTNQKGAALLKEFLATNLGMQPDEMKFVDGSGLSRYNLVSAHQLVEFLVWASRQPYAQEFRESLSIAGIDGTLKERMQAIASWVYAKTGTLGGVLALSGFIDNALVFSILCNGFISPSAYTAPCKREIEDAICLLLAGAA